MKILENLEDLNLNLIPWRKEKNLTVPKKINKQLIIKI